MKGLVFHGPGQSSWDTVPDPGIEDATDVIVRVDAVTICGTDLHILKGDVPEVRPGTVLGHEAVGEVVEAGSDVRTVRPGDRVLVSRITACGRCAYCRKAMYGQCRAGGGWILGHLVDGTQPEYVRVPHADLSVHPLPSTPRTPSCPRTSSPPGTRWACSTDRCAPATPSPSSEQVRSDWPRSPPPGRLPTGALGTHIFPLDHMEKAYDVFAKAADTGAPKVVLGGTRHEEVAVQAAGQKDVTSHA